MKISAEAQFLFILVMAKFEIIEFEMQPLHLCLFDTYARI